jgi:hypothetical protein
MIFANFMVVVEHATNYFQTKQSDLVEVASLLTLVMWFAFYYWWRLFSKVAFYVSLLMETIKDLKLFLGFYIMIIITFSTMIMVLN